MKCKGRIVMRQYVISVWSFIDPLYYRCTRLNNLMENLDDNKNIFRVRLTRYKGREITLSDGTTFKKNDLLIKIHFHNVRLLKEIKEINSEIRKAKWIFQEVQKSLPGVERYIRNHKYSLKIKGIIGITSTYTASHRLGFEIFPIIHPLYKWLKWATSAPIMILSKKDVRLSRLTPPSYLLMSKDKLSKLYKK